MKSLKGYFDNIYAAKINNKSVVEQLFTSSSKLAATNEDLVAIVKNCPTRLRISKDKPPASRKRAADGA